MEEEIIVRPEEIIIRSEEITEILSKPPSWIFKWGISIILFLIILFTCFSFFIKYPDTLTGEINITSINPPVTIIASTSGRLQNIFVKKNQVIKADQPIAFIENSCEYNDFCFLEKQISYFNSNLDSIEKIKLSDTLKLGELTPYYLQIQKIIKNRIIATETNSLQKKITLLNNDIKFNLNLKTKYLKQLEITSEQLKLNNKDLNRDNDLLATKTISDREYENKKNSNLSSLNNYEQAKITLDNNSLQINSYQKEILLLQTQIYQENENFKNELNQNIISLMIEMKKWKRKYVITSPINGKITFFNIYVTNQNIKNEEELFYVIPTEKTKHFGKCILPIINSGKIKVGQKVNIKLTNLNSSQVGIIKGSVENISLISNKDTYSIDVKLPNGLITTYGINLNGKTELKGKADIITEEITLAERIFFNFRKYLNN